jgi:hypothetical protein
MFRSKADGSTAWRFWLSKVLISIRQAPQLSLYAQSPLATYRPSVASGIALHALQCE